VLALFQQDPDTKAVALFCEIGTVAEEEAAELILAGGFTKPAAAYIAGRTLPTGMRYSHASAIVERGRGTAESKVRAFEKAGVHVVDHPHEMATILADILRKEAK